MKSESHHNDEKHKQKHDAHDEHPEAPKSPFEFGLFRADDQALGDGAEGRLRPRLEHARGRGSAHHRRP